MQADPRPLVSFHLTDVTNVCGTAYTLILPAENEAPLPANVKSKVSAEVSTTSVVTVALGA